MTHPPKSWLDHFVVAIDDLEQGIASFEEMSGVTPQFGGEHPSLGTHNALVSLGPAEYLEILAPRPGAELSPMFAEAGDHDTLTPILWACATRDIQSLHADLKAAGFDAPEPSPGSRVTSTGETLSWSMFMMAPKSPRNSPFFIEWHSGAPHPATSTPGGCFLASYRIGSTDFEDLKRLLTTAGLAASVVRPGESIEVELESPRGTFRL